MKSFSVVMATYNKAWALPRVLGSILRQMNPQGEVIVVDDGSTDNTAEICNHYPLRYKRLDDAVGVSRNPATARNVGYCMAKGEVIIAQSDDVVHVEDTVIPLVDNLKEGQVQIATVWDFHNNQKGILYTGKRKPRVLFFLGSLWRKDLYAVGGNDEEFEGPGREDVWFGLCLTKGLGLQPIYRDDVVGHHLHHSQAHPREYMQSQTFKRKVRSDCFVASGGPWQHK